MNKISKKVVLFILGFGLLYSPDGRALNENSLTGKPSAQNIENTRKTAFVTESIVPKDSDSKTKTGTFTTTNGSFTTTTPQLFGKKSESDDQPRKHHQSSIRFWRQHESRIDVPVVVIPPDFESLKFDGEIYYFNQGKFYQLMDLALVPVPAPEGAVIERLPTSYEDVEFSGTKYYLYQGVYYQKVREGYKVVKP